MEPTTLVLGGLLLARVLTSDKGGGAYVTARTPGGIVKIDQTKMRRAVERAKLALKQGSSYKLGTGGYSPASANRVPVQCDCSGFISWVIELKREPARGWWIETTNMVRDARGDRRFFTEVDVVQPGVIAAYPDAAGRQGHTVILVDGWKGIDCSYSRGGVVERDESWIKQKPGFALMVPTSWIVSEAVS